MRSFFFFSSRRRHTRFDCDWSSDVCSSDLRPDPSDRERAARLHRDLPELDRADLVEDLLDEIVQADGHAAGAHDDVAGRTRVREARAERVADIGDDTEVHHLAAALLDGPAERESVRVVDLAGRARLPWLD